VIQGRPIDSKNPALRALTDAFTVLLLCFALTVGSTEASGPAYQDGDLVFQTSTSGQSKAISIATGSEWTHVGVIFMHGGKPMVFEAIQPVQTTPLDKWIRRGDGQRYEAKRLRDRSPLQANTARESMLTWARSQKGKNYDMSFAWSDHEMYCSELVWKLYKEALGIELAPLQTVASFSLESPEVQRQIRKRWPRGIPPNEPMIAPVGLFDSPLLMKVPR